MGMSMFLCLFVIFLINYVSGILGSDPNNAYYSGIPVPGRRVPAVRFFELYINLCQAERPSEYLDQLSKMMKNAEAEQIAEKMQRALYFAVDDLDVNKMTGKWYTVVDSPDIHSDRCSVSFYKLLDESEFLATFSTLQYSVSGDGAVRLYHGVGRKMGPDSGNLLITSGNPSDSCPYFPVKVGPLNSKGKYDYVILTQALKHPTMVIARDPSRFEKEYQSDARDYLSRYGYMGGDLHFPLQFMNYTACPRQHLFYMDLEENDAF